MELIVIFLIVFFVLGPEKTILAARKLGKLLRTLKVYITSITGDLRETVVEPLQEIQEPLKDIAAPLSELTEAIEKPAQELNKTVRDLERAPVSKPAAKADETKADELEFAELDMAEAEPVETGPGPEAHVDADKEDAGDVTMGSDENSRAPEIVAAAAGLKT